jgi:methylglutaconyl-CoA hydratase
MRRADAQSAFLRGNRFSATDAAEMGLINMAVPADRLDAEVEAALNDLLAGNPRAIAIAKQLATHEGSTPLEVSFERMTKLSNELFESDDAHEGMAAYLEKRPASWVRTVSRKESD